ncbi:CvpA family protein [Ketogulonicigenium vulgare]|uniref:CvpA family protein n=1 Tax=Ketogulonicigenium vulgare (strain WSH-001) TaxID=759362 RepID=F9Y496_KETVW|nr:CvpA family protein [Ketogulonicigenium vulgare]AEM40532.1 CvpA family protein [Ketogulonicigenium vulgare WSH-001]ALJ80719.1 colicin V production CvpA [Ketogulonicigenium vulgare]ANW33521.1 colicin V production CvpA [Ketogulonicigenium vulgare]AOZ54251.1 CvpA family protein [Ketogulonicigenium vulgare]
MEGFTIIDAVVAAVILLSALLAYSRGLVRETLAIGGWVVSAILAFMFAGQAAPIVRAIPVVGDLIADSCELSIIGGAGLIFAVVLMITAIFTPLFSSLIHRSVLGGIDQGFGFLFGVLRGILLVAVAYFAYQTFQSAQGIAMVDNSRSAQIFAGVTERFASADSSAMLDWINAQYSNLISSCAAPAAPETLTVPG